MYAYAWERWMGWIVLYIVLPLASVAQLFQVLEALPACEGSHRAVGVADDVTLLPGLPGALPEL